MSKNTFNTTVKCKPSRERIMLHECIAGAYKMNLHYGCLVLSSCADQKVTRLFFFMEINMRVQSLAQHKKP